MPRLDDLVGLADSALGASLEAATRRHHRRRLTRVGWHHALDGTDGAWAQGGPPPRDGNRVEVCIDGASALPAMVAAIRSARSSVHVAGWAISPDFIMEREPELVTLRGLLAAVATRVDVRVLVWAGAPVPVFHPTRAEARRRLHELVSGTSIRGGLDRRNRPLHCHHEKVVVIDGRLAFVGGIDLTHVAGDRFDAAPHPGGDRLGWHDVAARLEGPSVGDVAAHFAMRWAATTGERLAAVEAPAVAGSSRVQVVRTIPEHTYRAVPLGDFSILDVYLGALRAAERLIYLENQFLWSAEVVRVLRDKLARPPSIDFRIVIVLPMQPNNGNEASQGQLAVLREADRDNRLLVATIGPTRPGARPVYVHAKVGIVDDRWLTVGSANLNEHSLFNDTEMNIVTDDAGLARSVRERLWSEHLAADCTGREWLAVLEESWRPLVLQGSRPGVPLRALPTNSRRATRLFGPINGLLVDG